MEKHNPERGGSGPLKAGESVTLNVVKPVQIVLKLRADGVIDISIYDLPDELSN